MPHIFALLFIVLCLVVILFQICLMFGAPWGRFTQGGAHEGRLPMANRVGCFVSIIVMTCLGASIGSGVGYWPNWPAWAGWTSVGVIAVGCVLNLITPSKPERKLWAPITMVMVCAALGAMILGERSIW